jgi:hypothetical protein
MFVELAVEDVMILLTSLTGPIEGQPHNRPLMSKIFCPLYKSN